MEMVDYSRFVGGLAFVVVLMYALAYGVKKLGLDKKLRGATGAGGRLQVADVLFIDPKRKLLLVKADAREYVLLISGEQVTLIDKLGAADA